jgi:hypothetical protein
MLWTLACSNKERLSMQTSTLPNNAIRPKGIIVVAVLMILFGAAEIVTGFTHDFFRLTTAQVNIATFIGVALGLCYFVGGWLILTKRKWAAILAIALLCIDFAGRIVMVLASLYPIDSFRQLFAIAVGTAIAGLFAIYIARKLSSFS